MILVGDIGATKVNLAQFDVTKPSPLNNLSTFRCSDFNRFEEILDEYCSTHPTQYSVASLGIAGPVTKHEAQLTNLSWTIERKNLMNGLGVESMLLMNDMEAMGWSLSILPTESIQIIKHGRSEPGNRALIAPGTGLGESILFWNGRYHRPVASEGSHSDFAPSNPLEIMLLEDLLKKYNHVSWEKVVSGEFGFSNLFNFLKKQLNLPVSSLLDEAVHEPHFGAIVSDAAAEGDELAIETIKLFLDLFAAEAGNLALQATAIGGVYLGGGIPPKLLTWLDTERFSKRFCSKGRFHEFLQEVPVFLLKDSNASLLGAGNRALRELRNQTTQ